MFALAGIVYAKLLPVDRAARILGMPNRLAVALGLSIVSVGVELFLHATGTFHWHYWWWNTPFVPLIIIFGYLWFYLYAAWVYDAPTPRHPVDSGRGSRGGRSDDGAGVRRRLRLAVDTPTPARDAPEAAHERRHSGTPSTGSNYLDGILTQA